MLQARKKTDGNFPSHPSQYLFGICVTGALGPYFIAQSPTYFRKKAQLSKWQKSRKNRTNMDIPLLFLAKPLAGQTWYHTSAYHLSAFGSQAWSTDAILKPLSLLKTSSCKISLKFINLWDCCSFLIEMYQNFENENIFLCLEIAEIDMGFDFGWKRKILHIKTHFLKS